MDRGPHFYVLGLDIPVYLAEGGEAGEEGNPGPAIAVVVRHPTDHHHLKPKARKRQYWKCCAVRNCKGRPQNAV